VPTASACTAGYEVKVAGDGSQGIEALHTGQFDCVLCELNMPKVDGLQLVKKGQGRNSTQVTANPDAIDRLFSRNDQASAASGGIGLDRQALHRSPSPERDQETH